MKQLKSLLALLLVSATTGCVTSAKTEDAQPRSGTHLPAYSGLQDDSERAHHLDVAYFAGGCFWGMQDDLNQTPGVVSTLVGYCGGRTNEPTYALVCRHDTGHAETVRVVYDPKKIAYKTLAGDFLDMHDPTTLNRQGPDIGDQYRSAIFYANDEQKTAAQAAIVNKAHKIGAGRRVVTTLEKFKIFYTAEDYHQNYIAKTGAASCHLH